jgi:hypothetical protein
MLVTLFPNFESRSSNTKCGKVVENGGASSTFFSFSLSQVKILQLDHMEDER